MILYKYIPLVWNDNLSEAEYNLNQERLKCLEESMFWFPKPNLLNDPFDCRPLFKQMDNINEMEAVLDNLSNKELDIFLKKYPQCSNKSQILSLLDKMLNSQVTDQNVKVFAKFLFQSMAWNLVNTKIDNIGILSMTTSYQNCLMWSHYASNHQGICIEIEIPDDTLSLRKVTYSRKQPKLNLYEAMHQKYGRFVDLFYNKSRHWKHEKEWRMVSHMGNTTKHIPGAKITRLIFGINTSEKTKEMLSSSISNDVKTHQVKMQVDYTIS